MDGQRTEYRGATVYTWSFSALAGGQGGMQLGLPIDPSSFSRPTVTVMDDRVLISTLPSHAKREVRRVAKLAEAGQEAEVHAGLSAAELSGDATMVSFADWAVFYGNLYTQLRALAPMIGDLAGGEADLPLPFKLDSLPDMDVLTRHFSASERRWVKVDDGFMDITVSSLGPEIPAILFGVGSASVMFMPAAVDIEVWDELDSEFLEVEGSIPEPSVPRGSRVRYTVSADERGGRGEDVSAGSRWRAATEPRGARALRRRQARLPREWNQRWLGEKVALQADG